MINVGDTLSTVGVFSTVERYHKYRRGCSVPWGHHDTCGGYHEYRGRCSILWGISSLRYPPWYWTHIIQGVYCENPTASFLLGLNSEPCYFFG